MKTKLTLAALALTLGMMSCNNNGFSINGTVEGATDGDTVLIMTYADGQLDTICTTQVKNGKFSASGQTENPVYAIAMYQHTDDGSTLASDFFLENAHISIAMNPDSVISEVSGTDLNKQVTALNKRAYALQNLMQSATGRDELDSLGDCMTDLYKRFITDNIENVAGQFYLSNFFSNFDDDFIAEQLGRIPESAQTDYAKGLKEQLDKKQATQVGKPFIDIKAPTPDGPTASVAQLAKEAKVLMIDFWASWCGPCRAEMPNVRAVYEKYHHQGFDIIGVSLDEDAEAWKKAIAELGLTWTQISDLKGWECEGAGSYGVQAIPATVLIKDGKIVARDVRGDDLEPTVAGLLKE